MARQSIRNSALAIVSVSTVAVGCTIRMKLIQSIKLATVLFSRVSTSKRVSINSAQINNEQTNKTKKNTQCNPTNELYQMAIRID